MTPFKTQDPNLRAQLTSFARQHGMEAALNYEAILLSPSPETKEEVKPPRKGNGRSWYSLVFSRIDKDSFTPSREILSDLAEEERRRVLVALTTMTNRGYIERRGEYHKYEYRSLVTCEEAASRDHQPIPFIAEVL